jgi:hypothetical protein
MSFNSKEQFEAGIARANYLCDTLDEPWESEEFEKLTEEIHEWEHLEENSAQAVDVLNKPEAVDEFRKDAP